MIDILISTYNGEKYLSQLLDSLLNQVYQNFKILIRDDGSYDNTLNIISFYAKSNPQQISYLDLDSINIGVLKSFERLLTLSTSNYIMFCDQDDVWLPDKIGKTLNLMQESEAKYVDKPILIHTDLTVVDQKLNIIHESFWKYSRISPELLTNFNYLGVCNAVTGCTSMINKKAKEICLPFSEYALMHDSWLALNIAKNGNIALINEPTILYRQHDKNQIGAQSTQSTSEYILKKTAQLFQVIKKNRLQIKLLESIGYGSCIKYFRYKILYFIKQRL